MRIKYDGTVVFFIPEKEEERLWLENNTTAEGWQWLGDSLGVDHRMAEDLIAGVQDAGFNVTAVPP